MHDERKKKQLISFSRHAGLIYHSQVVEFYDKKFFVSFKLNCLTENTHIILPT